MNPHTLTDFLTALHHPNVEGFIDLRALPSKRQTFIRPSDIEAVQRFINMNGDQDLYFGVATRKSSGDGSLINCGELYAIFVDIDFKTISEADARATLERFPLKPSIIVNSGWGLHCYWLLKEPLDLQDPEDCQRVYSLLRRLVLALGADSGSAEPTRVLRVPGTLNHKYTPARRVLIEAFNPERAFNPSDFDDVLPEEPEPHNGNRRRFTLPDEIAEGDPGRDNMLYRFGRKLKCAGLTEGEITDALIAANQARCRPPLPEEHVREKAHHVATQPDQPDFAANGNSNGGSDPLALLRALADSPTAADIEAALREAVKSLGRVDSLRLQTVRQEMIALLKIRKVSGAAGWIDSALSLIADGGGTDSDHADFLTDPEPWAEPVEGAILLDTISGVLRRYMVMTTEQADTCALWAVFAHTHDAFHVSPILAVQSPVMGCGKSRLQSVLTPMLPRALLACNLTSATLFRTVEKYKPTLLLDEADTFMKDNEGLRGIVNGGWLRSGAQTIRLVGDEYEPQTFSTWCPKVIAAIGKLPPTIQDRSIVIELKRKKEGERVEEFSQASVQKTGELKSLCRQAARWEADNLEALREMAPSVPAEITSDRAADNWRPLLAIADLAGSDWPDRARTAALILSGGERDPEADGAGAALIADCVTVFTARGVDRLSTTDLIAELKKIEERPWGEWNKGKSITPRGLAKLLKPFGIRPKVERVGDDIFRGYEAHGFNDPLSRYSQGSNVLHPLQPNNNKDLDPNFNVLQTPDVTDTKSDLSIEKERDVTHVTDRNLEFSGEEEVDTELDVTDPAFEARCAADLDDLFASEEVII